MILDHCEVTNTTARSWIVVEIAEIHYAAPGAWPVGLREDHRALMLEETGLAVVFDSEGSKKLYRITPEGEAQLKRDETIADAILTQLERMGRKMDRVREVFAAEAEDEEMAQDLRAARRDLRAVLRERRRSSSEEQQRIAAILKRAADEIRSK